MKPQRQLLAELVSKSLGLGEDWRVVDVEMRGCAPGADELHVYVERAPGRALRRPKRGAMHGVYDTRERTWRHLDIWQYKTHKHNKPHPPRPRLANPPKKHEGAPRRIGTRPRWSSMRFAGLDFKGVAGLLAPPLEFRLLGFGEAVVVAAQIVQLPVLGYVELGELVTAAFQPRQSRVLRQV